ncbi:hypothetical protein EB796_014662 [Bugula neritina]|uniref:Uncharacterized protein n=1 Tax=Bugula neritina TaxID=10212 RepID=A0A7J7JN27_BUGNE|nr:hypothetical protein EB796_014662 [Bugula neritina]
MKASNRTNNYKPITKRSCNPELKISKTGTVEFRFAKLVKPNAHVTNSTNPGRINVTEKILNRKILKPEREQLKKITTPTNSLSIPQPKPVVSTTSQSAEGFPLTVKITSKTNSAAITPDL